MVLGKKNYFRSHAGSLMMLFVLAVVGCDRPSSRNGDQGGHIDKTEEGRYDALAELLLESKLDEFYRSASQEDLSQLRRYFEQQVKNGKTFNYGVLINTDIVTEENKILFKPDVKKLEQLSDVPNENMCYMNASLYAIANSSFFDEFLEIDKTLKEDWWKRDQKTLEVVNPILRSLREIIYEIRLGLKTKPARIAALRKRHIAALVQLEEPEIAVNLYRELLTSYHFERLEFVTIEAGNKVHRMSAFDNTATRFVDGVDLKPIVENFRMIDNSPYGVFGALSCSLTRSSGNRDIIYFHTLLPAVDPWGKTARYLSGAVFDRSVNAQELGTLDPYLGTHDFVFSIKNSNDNFKLIHNALSVVDGNRFARYPVFVFRNLSTKNETGKITYRVDVGAKDSSFILVAKTRHSTNHQIAEIFRYPRDEWETHNFFGAAKFAKTKSPMDDGHYQDQLYFFEKDEAQ